MSRLNGCPLSPLLLLQLPKLSHNMFYLFSSFVCYDMKSRSRPRLVSSAYIFVITSNSLVGTLQVHSTVFLGHDINYLLRPTIFSFYVTTSKRCRDMIFLEAPSVLVSANFLLSQQLLLGLLSLPIVTRFLCCDFKTVVLLNYLSQPQEFVATQLLDQI